MKRLFRQYNPGRETRWGTAHGGNPPAWWLFQQAPAPAPPQPPQLDRRHILGALEAAHANGRLADHRTFMAAWHIGVCLKYDMSIAAGLRDRLGAEAAAALAVVAVVVPEVGQLSRFVTGGNEP